MTLEKSVFAPHASFGVGLRMKVSDGRLERVFAGIDVSLSINALVALTVE